MKCHTHADHTHVHGNNCGHKRIRHGNHIDFLHEGHLHHVHGTHVDEHILEITSENPAECRRMDCPHSLGHELDGVMIVPHGDHFDFVVYGRLHHVHGDHCDDHGPVEVIN